MAVRFSSLEARSRSLDGEERGEIKVGEVGWVFEGSLVFLGAMIWGCS